MSQVTKIIISVIVLMVAGATGFAVQQSSINGIQNERIAVVETIATKSEEHLLRIESKIDGLYELGRDKK